MLGMLAALLISACGAGSATNSGFKDVLLTAARVTTSQSFRADMTVSETFGSAGQSASQFNALSGQAINLGMHFAVQNAQRSSADITTTVAGFNVKALAVLFDGTVFVSTNGGATYQTVPTSAGVTSEYGPSSVLQYLQSVGTVTDAGPGVADGASVERYHADLDGSKMTAIIKSAMSSLKSPLFTQLLDTVSFTGGHLDASVDHAGRVVSEGGVFDASMDLGALDPSSTGSAFTIHATFDGHFHDYGAPITVTRPAHVTGTATLP